MAHQGKVVLVTGGGGGLGRAIADHFFELGANVVICDINKDLLADFNDKVVPQDEKRALAVECDVTKEPDLDRLFDQAEQKFGAFDYVINSAGVADKCHPAGSLEKSEWDLVLAINLTAPVFVTKRAVNAFIKAGKKGSIVNIASVASFKGFANGAAYTASKHGLLGLTKNTAAFYRSQGIRCNAIQCGAMRTNISRRMADGLSQEGMGVMMKSFNGDIQGSMVDVDKVAILVAYLCSPESELINGAAITADAGATVL